MDAVASIAMDRQGILDEQQERDAYQFKPHLKELERMNQQIQGCFVFENRYTQYTWRPSEWLSRSPLLSSFASLQQSIMIMTQPKGG